MQEVVGFTEKEGGETELVLSDGSALRVKTVVNTVVSNGNDPNTGVPIYAVQITNVVKTVRVPKELIATAKPAGTTYG